MLLIEINSLFFNILCDICVKMNDVNVKNLGFNIFLSRNFWMWTAFICIFVADY